MCELMENWEDMSPEERMEAYEDWLNEVLEDMGLDPDDYDIKFEPPPGHPEAPGGYDHENNDFYINPENFEGEYSGEYDPEAYFDANTAMEVGAHEARHAQQDDVYSDYGIEGGTEADRGWREDDAGDFADSYVPEPEEECPRKPSDSIPDKDDMPRPSSPAGDFPLPPGDVAYA